MERRTLWVSFQEFQRLTAEDHARWNIGIDLTRGGDWRCDADALTREYQKDHDDYLEEMSIGGRPYRGDR